MSEPETKIIMQTNEATGSGLIVKWGTLPLGVILIFQTSIEKIKRI
jgi:hypothetical protein